MSDTPRTPTNASWTTDAMGRLLRAPRREERAVVYAELAHVIADAPWCAVGWRKRNCVVVRSSTASGASETRLLVRESEEYEQFRRTERLRAGRIEGAGPSLELVDLDGGVEVKPHLPMPPDGPPDRYRMWLPEGIACGAPRVFVAGGEVERLGEVEEFLNALSPHWSERRSLRRQSSLDFLTGVYNYRHLRRFLRRACRRASAGGQTFSILMVDVDHLRDYNTAFGHLMGSRVLAQIGRAIRDTIRDGDFVAKYGGDEFVVILPGATKSGAVENALRIKSRIHGQGFYGVDAGAITCSIGVASFGEDGSTYEELVGAADRAVYAAKDRGRNAVVAIGRGELKGQASDGAID